MRYAIAEMVGILLLAVGALVGVAAGAQVSTALALAVLSVELVFAGVVTVYVASEIEKASKTPPEAPLN